MQLPEDLMHCKLSSNCAYTWNLSEGCSELVYHLDVLPWGNRIICASHASVIILYVSR